MKCTRSTVQLKGIAYKVSERTCQFRESIRRWESWGAEHRPGTNRKQYVEATGHGIHPNNTGIRESKLLSLSVTTRSLISIISTIKTRL